MVLVGPLKLQVVDALGTECKHIHQCSANLQPLSPWLPGGSTSTSIQAHSHAPLAASSPKARCRALQQQTAPNAIQHRPQQHNLLTDKHVQGPTASNTGLPCLPTECVADTDTDSGRTMRSINRQPAVPLHHSMAASLACGPSVSGMLFGNIAPLPWGLFPQPCPHSLEVSRLDSLVCLHHSSRREGDAQNLVTGF